jgi:hypothetical protein
MAYYELGGKPVQGGAGAHQPTRLPHCGNQFGPFTSANLTPNGAWLPAGLTLEEFIHLMRTGEPRIILPWGP